MEQLLAVVHRVACTSCMVLKQGGAQLLLFGAQTQIHQATYSLKHT